MAQIGLKNLYYAPITEDDEGIETYGAPVKLAKAISADLSVNSDDASLYADDGADVSIREFQSGTITLEINDLGISVAASLLDARIDANGVLISAGEDTPPAVALGFQSRSAKGGDRYFWLYRVTFGVPGQKLNTKGTSIEFSTPSIEGKISRRNKVDSKGKHPWKGEVKAGEPGVVASTITNWFNSVYEGDATPDATLTSLAIGSSTLSPTFDANTTEYTVATSTVSEAITAVATDSVDASIIIVVNGNSITNGDDVTWNVGANSVVIVVTNGSAVLRYYVTVTYSTS